MATQMQVGDRVVFTHRKSGRDHRGTVVTVRDNRNGQPVLTIKDETHDGAFRAFRLADCDNLAAGS
jgi:hypothetical protein